MQKLLWSNRFSWSQKAEKNLMQVDESSKNSNEHIVVDTVVHLDRYKAMNMRVNFIFYTCFTWWVSALRGWCASFGGHSPIRTALWIQQHVNRTHMEFICSNEKHNRGNNNNNWGYYSYVLIFPLPFCHILCYVNRPPSDILIPRITRKDNEQNETKWDQRTHTHSKNENDGVDKYICNASKSFMHVKYFYNLNFSRR